MSPISKLSRNSRNFLVRHSPSDIDESGIFNLEHELKRLRPRANLKAVIASVTDGVKIAAVIGKHKPEIIFHAAAYKHVPLMENHPEEAIKVNILGTLNTARAATEYGVKKFVLVSTDKAVRPVSVMGKTKRIAEMVVKSLNNETETNFVAVRFGNVLGSRGSVIPLFQEQIRRGGPVTVTHPDMVRYFMTIPEASLLVMEAGAVGQGGEIFILDMGRPVKIIDLARELIRLSGYTPDIHIPIAITGIRPGENLFEDILTEEE
ncbi:MAG: polysaccharide biosynthesis protein, partial [Candidatus Colwellbacteria bacterium]|nr:polysaccharide biosynthesis protein [Candidatus Colwellbacteria bacterium]